MVGTPQLPFKYRRKASSDYRVYSPDLDMALHSPTSSINSHGFGSECSMPRSPSLYYSSSSSIAPSSPIHSLHSPELPLSPVSEPHIASSSMSPKLDGRKGFWEVAFNYGPNFPYKGRPLAQTSNLDREQFLTRRRSSSTSAPALVSDNDPSDHSEDMDSFHMDDFIAAEVYDQKDIAVISSEDTVAVSGLQADATTYGGNAAKPFDGEIDAAAVLLDLSRHVRFVPAESKPDHVAISATSSSPLNMAQQECPASAGDDAHTSDGENASALVASVRQADSVLHGSGQDVDLSNLNEHEIHALDNLESASDVNSHFAEDLPDSTEPKVPHVGAGIQYDEDNVVPNEEISNSPISQEHVQLIVQRANGVHDIEESSVANLIVDSIFSSVLTPISSPALSGSDLTELSEPLSNLSSPKNSAFELPEISESKQGTRRSDDLKVESRLSSPVPGPSHYRTSSGDEHNERMKLKYTTSRKARSGQDAPDTKLKGPERSKSGKKRGRSDSVVESRSSSPALSASCPDASRPRKKRNKKTPDYSDGLRDDIGNVSKDSKDSSLFSHSAPSAPTHDPSSIPRGFKTDSKYPDACANDDADAKKEMYGCLIQAMALSRASSMPASSLLREVLRENPHLGTQRSRSDWLGITKSALESHDVFGRIDREGLDADDKPLETQWFYIPENDPDQDRAALLREMMPKKRNETKKHKQYFFKPIGKLSRWDSEDSP